MKTKQCCRCEKSKPLTDFYKDKSRPDGYAYSCKQCNKKTRQKYSRVHREKRAKYQREYYTKYPEKRGHLLFEYGITLKEYGSILEKQGGGCAICSKTPEENGKRLAVDHDHKTGEVRGLLCHNCNIALGFLKDEPKLCEMAKLYLQKHGK